MGPKQQQTKTKTADTSRESESYDSESFSPIQVKESPGCQRQGNLTGSARKLKDGAADIHNLLLKWNNLNVDGFNILNDIANIKLEHILGQTNDNSVSDQGSSPGLPATLLPLCDRLTVILKKMEGVLDKLSGIKQMMKGVQQLELYKGGSAEEPTILFQTWDLNRFVTVVNDLLTMYTKESQLKQAISERICHADSRNTIMFYTAAWLHEPYSDSRAKLLVESLLVETGHK